MVPELCKVAAEKGYSLFRIGRAEGIAEKTKENLKRDFRELRLSALILLHLDMRGMNESLRRSTP